MNRRTWRIAMLWILLVLLGVVTSPWVIFGGSVFIVLADVLSPPDERTARRLGL